MSAWFSTSTWHPQSQDPSPCLVFFIYRIGHPQTTRRTAVQGTRCSPKSALRWSQLHHLGEKKTSKNGYTVKSVPSQMPVNKGASRPSRQDPSSASGLLALLFQFSPGTHLCCPCSDSHVQSFFLVGWALFHPNTHCLVCYLMSGPVYPSVSSFNFLDPFVCILSSFLLWHFPF